MNKIFLCLPIFIVGIMFGVFIYVEFFYQPVVETYYAQPYIPTREELLEEADRMLADPNCKWVPVEGENDIYKLECPVSGKVYKEGESV